MGGLIFGDEDEDEVRKDARPLLGGVAGGGVCGSFSGSLMTMRESRWVGGLCSMVCIMIAHGPGCCVCSFFFT